MNATELKGILESAEFRMGLDELSAYLASIMQERPIVHLLAKCLWQKRYEFELEDKLCDLTVNGTRLEFKFNYDKMKDVLKRELMACDNDSQAVAVSAGFQAGKKSKTWGVLSRIHKDICLKKPDIFVWIICSRDLSDVTPRDLKRICNGREQRKYQETHRYGSDREFLAEADSLLERLQAVRQFSILNAEVATARAFPSTYYFKICEFSKAT